LADGVAPTNGLHPLWMIICVLAQGLTGPVASIHVVLTTAALVHCVHA
jgi:hypothetical protein